MSRDQVMEKRGFTDRQYQRFATSVGHKINFNKKMRMLAQYFEVSIFHLAEAVKTSLISESEEVVDLILEFRSLGNEADDHSVPGIISREIYETTIESFKRNCDPNHLTDSIIKSYINENGTALDVQAQMMEETHNMGIEVSDLVDFMLEYPDGPKTYQTPFLKRRKEINETMYELVGFKVTDRLANQFHSEFFLKESIDENPPF